MNEHTSQHDRIYDLLTQQATGALTDSEQLELNKLMAANPDIPLDALDLAAAALELAFLRDIEPMPDSIRQRLFRAADQWNASLQSSTADNSIAIGGPGPIPISPATRPNWFAWTGWIAAAAAIAFALVVKQPSSPSPLDAAQARQALLAASTDARTANWLSLDKSPLAAPAPHPLDQGVVGDIIWSDTANEGYMRIKGIAANDPREFQYQLWIFDANRGGLEQNPVDGGVFDVRLTDSGEVIIPIDPKLRVNRATIFAVTKEPPGGVVVSDRDIVFLAALPG
ncbi:MAG: anti-sigma factor [Phycisphaeraceae bacterium]|nr:anti-sigma factor [Phycisphaeraceae bacterium]MCW5763577.1 anti-sigma factor [Phycisphaeraceae bacterium]